MNYMIGVYSKSEKKNIIIVKETKQEIYETIREIVNKDPSLDYGHKFLVQNSVNMQLINDTVSNHYVFTDIYEIKI